MRRHVVTSITLPIDIINKINRLNEIMDIKINVSREASEGLRQRLAQLEERIEKYGELKLKGLSYGQ